MATQDTTLPPSVRELAPVIRGALLRIAAGRPVTLAVAPGSPGQAELAIPEDGTPESIVAALESWSAAGNTAEFPRSIAIGGQVLAVGSSLGAPAERGGEELAAAATSGRADVVRGRVAVVTGGAQGFGAEIVDGLVANGALVIIVDLNEDGAVAKSGSVNQEHGPVTYAVAADVSNEASVSAMMDQIISIAGGVDLFVSNAGIVRAGSVKELEFAQFDLVTRVNYAGFFLCTRAASRVMAAQNAAAPQDRFSDIIQINSKSGLAGSNKNGAYAGSKFGGIGLVQSFALELATDRIKVNAICPGNFLDGPLWSDPEKGLFVQYLEAGKVPGAKSVADVKRHYESQVPLRRGCRGEDVARALLYVVEQRYETGQALPVTGGQIMLS